MKLPACLATLTLAVSGVLLLSAISLAADPPARGGVAHEVVPPRIPPLVESQWTEEQRALLAPIAGERGRVPNIYATMAQHPKMFTPRLNFGRYIQRESTLPPREREMLICRIAWLSGGEYEWSAHTRIGLQNGLTADDIVRLGAGPEASGWNDTDRAVMRAIDELYDNTFICDETWNALLSRFKMEQMMDLVMTVGTYHMLAMALNSFGVPLESGSTRFAATHQRLGLSPQAATPRGKPGTPTRLTAPRIPVVPEASWSAVDRELLEPLKQSRSYVPNVYATLARHPQMYRLWLAYARYILRESSLPAREREMLILRIAWQSSGEFEWSAHSRLGREAGLTDAEVAHTAVAGTAGWNAADTAVITAVDELHRDAFISDPVWNNLSARFTTPQMMDLVLTVGAYKMLAMALNSFGTQLDSGMTGFPK